MKQVLRLAAGCFSSRLPFNFSRMAEPQSFTAEHVDGKIIFLYDTLLVVGFYATGIVICTAAFSSRVQRSWNWYMAMIFWNLSCVEHLLLLTRQSGPQPPHALCLIEAGFVYAAPAASALAMACLVLQFYATLLEVLIPRRGLEKLVSRTLLFFPPLVFLGVFTSSLVIGLENPNRVMRGPVQVYCHVLDPFLPNLASSIVCFAAGVMIIFEVLACHILCRRWQRIKDLKASVRNTISVTTLIRFSLFTVGPVIGVGVSISRMGPTPRDSLTAAFTEASYPLWAALIFGTQRDIMSVWMFWRKSKQNQITSSTSFTAQRQC
ncbi:hypothetical protein DL96DRAFT_1625768 [Flagelloscypha sp. PMI_526]|nr:hypothetical protein DL96DRAFT_1625768 [Flagelloscypha sp. PMI_526]